ncbi:hypothetical protein [uncultured Gemmiger sp.]|uniref:hypothetical protein n=1 Tax=uncultured Gemmiger sp. TaxID=1623490 RepID=UPI0025E7DC2D|nr:hypothetical protein [uncultured Gemmiger sp.]
MQFHDFKKESQIQPALGYILLFIAKSLFCIKILSYLQGIHRFEVVMISKRFLSVCIFCPGLHFSKGACRMKKAKLQQPLFRSWRLFTLFYFVSGC